VKKVQINANFSSKFFKITTLKYFVLSNIVNFSPIFPKQTFKSYIFLNIQRGQKMVKWPNYFISGKQFQKRPNLADLA